METGRLWVTFRAWVAPRLHKIVATPARPSHWLAKLFLEKDAEIKVLVKSNQIKYI